MVSFRQTFGKSNKVYEAANNFASCSCPANKTNSAFYQTLQVLQCLFLIIGFICISDIIGIIILNLITLINILIGCKFTRKSQSA